MPFTPDDALDLNDPAAWAYYSQAVRSKESGGDINAKNPNSSANGLYQMIGSTRDKYAGGQDWSDPAVQEDAMKRFTADNAAALQARGFAPTARNLYATHFLGAGDAPDVLDAHKAGSTGDAVSDYVNDSSVSANPTVLGGNKTVGDFMNWAGGRFGSAGSPGPTGTQGATQPQDPPGLFDRMRAGAGVLFDPGTDGAPNRMTSVGDGLIGVGAALMARDKPAAAQALMAGVKDGQEQAYKAKYLKYLTDQQNKSSKDDNGTLIAKNEKGASFLKDGKVKFYPTPPDQKDDTPDEPNSKEWAAFKQGNTEMTTAADTINNAQKYAKMLANGEAHVSWDATTKTWIANMTNDADKNSVANKDIQAFFEKLKGDRVALEKGPATKFKILQAGQQFLPNGGEHDDAQVASALLRASQAMRGAYNVAANTNASMAAARPGLIKGFTGQDGQPVTDPAAHWNTQQAEWSKNHDELRQALDAKIAERARTNDTNVDKQGRGAFYRFFNK